MTQPRQEGLSILLFPTSYFGDTSYDMLYSTTLETK